MKKKLAVVAIGGNAIMPDSSHMSIAKQYEKVCETANYIADMLTGDWNVVLSHGNGPQVGLILRQSEMAKGEIPPVAMDYAGAYTQGAIGYMFCNALRNVFATRGLKMEPVAIVSQMVVDAADPAFKTPTKPVGNWYTEAEASAMAASNGWHVVEDSGRGWRRVVASPTPQSIVEINPIKHMISAGLTVIALGGGGIPVVMKDGKLTGVEAVIDKDMSAALLATELKADMLILPTAVEKVAVRFGKPDQKWLDKLSIAEAEEYLKAGEFPEGSMGPKVRALIKFVNATGGVGVITTPQSMKDAIIGTNGTHIVK